MYNKNCFVKTNLWVKKYMADYMKNGNTKKECVLKGYT